MYLPRHFAEDRDEVVLGLVRSAGFGHLVVTSRGGIESTPVPFVVDADVTSLRAHLARPNPIWKLAPCDALMIIPVTDVYISPTWYPSKAEHGKVVPTWNYEVVHLRGHLVAHDDPEWVHRQIRELTDTNERNRPEPWTVDDAPADYIAASVRGIVGIELEVDRIDAKRKLSQNRTEQDASGAVAGLRAIGTGRATAVADAMTS